MLGRAIFVTLALSVQNLGVIKYVGRAIFITVMIDRANFEQSYRWSCRFV